MIQSLTLSAADLESQAFFDRPINPVAQFTVGMLGGNRSELKGLITAAETISAVNNKTLTITPQTVYDTLPNEMRAEIEPLDTKNTAEAKASIDTFLSRTRSVLIGAGLELTSATQIVLEHGLSHYGRPIVLSGEVARIIELSPHLHSLESLILVVDTARLIKIINSLHIPVRTSRQRGIFQISDLAEALATKIPNLQLICYNSEQIVYFDATKADRFYHLSLEFPLDENEVIFSALLAGLISDCKNATARSARIRQILAFWGVLTQFSARLTIEQVRKTYRYYL